MYTLPWLLIAGYLIYSADKQITRIYNSNSAISNLMMQLQEQETKLKEIQSKISRINLKIGNKE